MKRPRLRVKFKQDILYGTAQSTIILTAHVSADIELPGTIMLEITPVYDRHHLKINEHIEMQLPISAPLQHGPFSALHCG